MTPEQWRRVKDALTAAMKRPAAERSAALDLACAGDAALRREVAELLESRDAMGTFLAEPMFGESPGGNDEAEPEVPAELRLWDRYHVLERIGAGGMATVYKAWDPRLRRPIAIKVIAERDATTVARFLREAEAQARVDHDNVLKVFETGTVGSHHYIAMQFVDGPTLAGVRAETTLEHKVRLMTEIAEGVHAAHCLGLVHRDLKPGNILVEHGSDGLKPYVLDFGLAAEIGAPGLTQTGVIVGTPHYMAPERIQRGDAARDRRSDIYSLGATFYEFLCGTAPFHDTSGLQVLVDALEREIPPLHGVEPALPVEIEAIVGKCLEKDPVARYASARALADDLRRYLNGEAVLARPTGRVDRLVRRARRHPRLTTAFAVLGVAIVTIAGWTVYQSWRAARQTGLAEALGQETQNIEWLYRAAQMSPVHAIDPQRQQVRLRMAHVEQLMRESGSIAFGPGHYALGRGLLTLGDSVAALAHLRTAWESGYHTADTAMALGLAHGSLFRSESARAQRIESDRDREARLRELERIHRDPAVAFLQQSRSSAIAPARYVDAVMSSHRGDVAGVIARAAEAARDMPWFFEAPLLSAQVDFTEAVRLLLRGELPRAAQLAADADRYYLDASRVAASSFDAHLGRCAVAGLALTLMLHQRATDDPTPVRHRADESCERARIVDPRSAEAHRYHAEALDTWATVRVQQRADPGDAFDRAADLAARATALAPRDPDNGLAVADIFMNRAWWESRTDRDPRGAIDGAVRAYDNVLAADRRNLTALNNGGQAFILRARYERAHEVDASASFDRAIAGFENALTVDPSLAVAYRNLGRIAVERADYQTSQGLDPMPGLIAALRFIETRPAESRLPLRQEAASRLRDRIDAARSK